MSDEQLNTTEEEPTPMGIDSLESILDAMNLPVVIGEWGQDEKPTWPFLEYHIASTDDFMAEGKCYYKRNNWNISIYDKSTDMMNFWTLCETLEAQLDGSDIQYQRSPDIFPGDGIVYADYSFYLGR